MRRAPGVELLSYRIVTYTLPGVEYDFLTNISSCMKAMSNSTRSCLSVCIEKSRNSYDVPIHLSEL